MTEIWLGVIAVSTLVMAVLQIAMAVAAMRAARRGAELMERLTTDLKPIVTQLQSASVDAARAASMAAAHVDRAGAALNALSSHVEAASSALTSGLVGVAMRGLVNFLGGRRPGRGQSRRARRDEDEPL